MRPGVSFLLFCLLACGWSPKPAESPISLKPIVTIDPGDGPGALASRPWVGPQLPDGSWAVIVQNGDLPYLYDSRGRFMHQLGHSSGPGEYEHPTTAIRSGDSLIVFDLTLRRATVVEGDTFVRSFPLPETVWSVVRLDDGSFAFTPTRYGSVTTIGRFDSVGHALPPLADTLPTSPRYPPTISALALAPDGTVWGSKNGGFKLVHWDLSGRLLDTLATRPLWFDERDSDWITSPENPPRSLITGLWVDQAGHVWIVAITADNRWAQGLGKPVKGEGGITYYPINDHDLVYDTIIEAYDPASGQGLASYRTDEGLMYVAEPGVVVSVFQDDEGWYGAKIWKVELQKR